MGQAPISDSISEEYYQINEAILDSFPKYRLPLDLFVFNENIAQLLVYSHKETRLSNDQVEDIHRICAEGNLFVSRTDHPVYSQHIAKQLDLVLVDQNLKEAEVADISILAISQKLDDFFTHPVRPVFERLQADMQVLTEYIWPDLNRLKLFIRRMHRGEHNATAHALNTFCVALWLYAFLRPENMKRKDFDQAALAFLLHDVGMIKIPPFILSKTTPLSLEEKEKIPQHTLAGYRIMHKLDQTCDAMRQATMEHHERLDGSGYPQHSKTISLIGRITAVADAFSAMLQKRPYAEAKDYLTAARELSDAKTKFDSALTGRLLAAIATGAFGNMR